MTKPILLSKLNPNYKIQVGDEPFLSIEYIDVKTEFNRSDFHDKVSNLTVEIIFYKYDQEKPQASLILSLLVSQNPSSNRINLTKKYDLRRDDIEQVEFRYKNTGDFEIDLEIGYLKIDKIEMHEPVGLFNGFLRKTYNSKILFSAPFGNGKTTFLQEFFKEKDEYEVFHLFPVNYSIATNEDIMQYIKVEILFQLFGRNVEFDKIEPDKFKSIALFAKDHIVDILLPFTRLIPQVGETVHEISKDLVKVIKKFRGYHKEHTIDDEKIATEFLRKYYSKEGSIYEDDFITQLIRQLLEQLEQQNSSLGTPKKTVLVVDDLDRMDPEHIFRILNVFGAHFDSENKDKEGSNKFGFNKVIIVCDIDNIKSIYHHKYGTNTKFDGYIDKFFSEEIFYFDNEREIKGLISIILKIFPSNFFRVFLEDMIATKNISLRELLRIRNLEGKIFDLSGDYFHYKRFDHFIIFKNLLRIMRWDDLYSKIENCKNKLKDVDNYKYNNLTVNAIITLKHISSHTSIIIENDQGKFICDYDTDYYPKEYFKAKAIYPEGEENDSNRMNPDILNFSSDEFYDTLLRIMVKFRGKL